MLTYIRKTEAAMTRFLVTTTFVVGLGVASAFAQEPVPDAQMQASVGFLGMIIIGVLAGWIAEKMTASDHGLFTNLLVGIAGSFVGGSLASLMNIQFSGWLGNLLVAAIGAVLVLWLWRFATQRGVA
jgi:uncharacterized membrane protein YeaQ/YmgE (transglycosylase-associated protein family)